MSSRHASHRVAEMVIASLQFSFLFFPTGRIETRLHRHVADSHSVGSRQKSVHIVSPTLLRRNALFRYIYIHRTENRLRSRTGFVPHFSATNNRELFFFNSHTSKTVRDRRVVRTANKRAGSRGSRGGVVRDDRVSPASKRFFTQTNHCD